MDVAPRYFVVQLRQSGLNKHGLPTAALTGKKCLPNNYPTFFNIPDFFFFPFFKTPLVQSVPDL